MHHQDAPRTADEARRRIESLLDEVADLSDLAIAPDVFFGQVLDRVTFATSAIGAAVWTKSPNGHLLLAHQTDLQQCYPTGQAAKALSDDEAHLFQIFNRREADIVPGSQTVQPKYDIVAVPLQVAGEAWGVMALYQPANLAKSVRQTYLRITHAFAEVAQHYQQQALLRDFQQHQYDWKRQLDFASLVHTDLSYDKTAYRIANEARNCLEADRVAVLSARGSKCRIEAISGVDKPHRRSNTVQKLEKLASAVVGSKQTLLYTGETENLPPQIEEALLEYLEETPSKVLAIVPLQVSNPIDDDDEKKPLRASEPVGAIAIESIEQLNGHELLHRAEPIIQHATTALGNARAYRQLPFASVLIPLRNGLATIGWYRLPTTLKVVIPLLVIIAALFLIPMDFSIEVHGQLVPAVERNVFAPSDGYVEEIFVKHGQPVEKAAPLMQLRSNEFNLQRAEIVGQLQTAQAELDAILVKRSQGMRRDPRAENRTPESFENLSADQLKLTKQIENLIQRRDLLQKREDELKLLSPINGQVLDWEVEQVLAARPVSRGELLMKVADIDGPWVLDLELPDKRTYHVVNAQNQSKEPLAVRFQLVNEPGKTYRGELKSAASIVDLDENSEEPFVPLEAEIDKSEIPHLRHGLSVVGRIECGQRSVAYVWTYQLVETVRRYLFW
ncbi:MULTISPECIES: efflux RND transporter periplasmic adaptor subunit [Pirellulaceae]|uniref:efflux RND transporter periplasmic adaptor subunit n=1 Tax=Pirellulaceae TaxID=2691357 RepID=UPI001304DC39|nr:MULTISPECIES: efflux RND transporter periplasmic adaptor subunit [Pirellulaceae]